MGRIKKIIELQKRLDTEELNEKQRIKLQKKVTKLSEDLYYTQMETDDTVPKRLLVFITPFGRQIFVEDYKIVYATKPKFNNSSKILPYLLAFVVLLLLFLVASVLNLFGVVSDGLLNSIAVVLGSAGIVMNLWTLYDSRKMMKQFRSMLYLNIFAILINGANIFYTCTKMIG